MPRHYDMICIGAGSGGIATANRAALHGAHVAVVESGKLGGTCVNVGCVPKKIMWYAAQCAEAVHNAETWGFDVDMRGFDWSELVQKRQAYITRLNHIYGTNLEKNGVNLIQGTARFLDAHTIDVDGIQYTADRFVIAVGAQAVVPDVPGVELGITSDGFFELSSQPKKVVIVGAGYIAVELAGVLNALGTETWLLIRKERPLRTFDADITGTLVEHMHASGIKLVSDAHIQCVSKNDVGQKTVELDCGRLINDVDTVLWAVGRRPNTSGLNLASIGIKVLENGAIPVNDDEQTNIEHIYAVGDVNGKAALTPVAIAAGRRLADRVYGGSTVQKLNYSVPPTVVFSHPPIGTIGLSEQQAREQYDDIHVYKSRFTPMSHALQVEKQPVMVKLITAGVDEKIVGVHAIGPGVDEMMQGFAVAMAMGATKSQFDQTIPIHPTLAEELVTLKSDMS